MVCSFRAARRLTKPSWPCLYPYCCGRAPSQDRCAGFVSRCWRGQMQGVCLQHRNRIRVHALKLRINDCFNPDKGCAMFIEFFCPAPLACQVRNFCCSCRRCKRGWRLPVWTTLLSVARRAGERRKWFDRFDRVFANHFNGASWDLENLQRDIPEDWLRKLVENTRAKKTKPRWRPWVKTRRWTPSKRLAEQRERHQGGNKWIGTGGTSPFGAWLQPAGVRIGGMAHATAGRSSVGSARIPRSGRRQGAGRAA